jgi:hypothetical protein
MKPLMPFPANEARSGTDKNSGECMRLTRRFTVVVSICGAVLLGLPFGVYAQETSPVQQLATAAGLPDAPEPEVATANLISTGGDGQPGVESAAPILVKRPLPQPKRILGVMPNYRAVSAGTTPPPFTPHEAFMVATRNTFDYSSFVFVGITSLLAEGTNAHSQLGKGVPGYWAYAWRGFVDKAGGNYWVDFIMPSMVRQDERYYAKGEGGILKRSAYAATRVVITPDFHGKNGFNTSEVLGRGISQAISLSYYPSQTQTLSGFAQKYGYALGRDAITNVFRELWPDISTHLTHHRRSQT